MYTANNMYSNMYTVITKQNKIKSQHFNSTFFSTYLFFETLFIG